jgi:predicted metal-dependent TIM-barrel fold hydrolase
MYYVDSHLHLETLTWENLESMYMTGIRVIVSPAQLGAAKPVSNGTVKDIWDFCLEVQLDRAKEHLIKGYAMIGISMVSTPSGDLLELLEWLPDYLKRPEVVGIGEIGIEPGSRTSKDLNFQEKIVREQLKILTKFNKAVVFHIPFAPENKIKYSKMMLNLCSEYGVPMSKVVIDHCSDANMEIVLQAGAFAAISVQPWRGITPEIAADLVIKYGHNKVIIDSDCSGGASDPLAVPRTAYALKKKGISDDIIKKVCRDNALAAYSIEDL